MSESAERSINPSRRILRFWPVAFVLLHFAKVGYWFHRVDWRLDFPLINYDYIQYYARVLRADAFLTMHGRFWGYDPFQSAGSISGPYLEVGTFPLSYICHVLKPVVSIERSLLILEVLGFLLPPFALLAAAKNFGADRQRQWISFAAGVLIFGALDYMSASLIRAGLFGFQAACFVALWQVSLLWAWLDRARPGNLILLTAVSAFVIHLHPGIIPALIIPNAVLYFSRARRLSPKQHLYLAIALAVVALANLFWIKPFVHFYSWYGRAPYFITSNGRTLWDCINPVQADWIDSVHNVMLIGLLLVLVTTFRRWPLHFIRQRNFFAIWLAWTAFLSYFGSSVPILRSVQPGRNSVEVWLLVSLILAWAGPESFRFITNQKKGWTIFLGTLLITAWCGVLNRSRRPALTNVLPASEQEFIGYLKKLPHQGRLLVEVHDNAVANIAEIIPQLTGLDVIGGPHAGNFLKTRSSLFAGDWFEGSVFVDKHPTAFGHPLLEMSELQFASYLKLYNVQYVAAESPASIERLNAFSTSLQLMERVGHRNIYRVLEKGSWFETGEGSVSASLDQLHIYAASGNRLLLRYHYIDSLVGDPTVEIKPKWLSDDPLPFIEIENPKNLSDIQLINKGLR